MRQKKQPLSKLDVRFKKADVMARAGIIAKREEKTASEIIRAALEIGLVILSEESTDKIKEHKK